MQSSETELDQPTVANTLGLSTAQQPCDWARLVKGIAAGDETACAELYSLLGKMRWFFARRLQPQEVEDRFHDVILALIQAIRQGAIREPERLLGYARTIAIRAVTGRINGLYRERRQGTEEEGRIISDPSPNPEMLALKHEKDEIAKRILMALPERDREVLIRFYLDGETAQVIQQELGITETQFRLIKSRAKARFADLVKSRLARRSINCFAALLRNGQEGRLCRQSSSSADRPPFQ